MAKKLEESKTTAIAKPWFVKVTVELYNESYVTYSVETEAHSSTEAYTKAIKSIEAKLKSEGLDPAFKGLGGDVTMYHELETKRLS